MTPRMPAQLNFADIDRFREYKLKINASQMALLLGVSRMTYWRWVEGKAIPSSAHSAKSREVLVALVRIIRERGWPTPDVSKLSYAQRFEKLLEELRATG